MTTQPKEVLKKWISLNDPDGASLKIGRFNNKLILVITGVNPGSKKFKGAIDQLGFTPSAKGAHLIKAVEVTDRITATMFSQIWPDAKIALLDPSQFNLDLAGAAKRFEQRKLREANANAGNEVKNEQDQQALIDEVNAQLASARYIGMNANGEKVYEGVAGRFVHTAENNAIEPEDSMPNVRFLRARTHGEVRSCAAGLLRSAQNGEPQDEAALLRFAGALLNKPHDELSHDDKTLIAQAVDSAVLEILAQNYETPGQAWADAAFYQEMMPGRIKLGHHKNQSPYLPIPIAIQIQRFLSDAHAVNINGKMPAFGFGLLSDTTRVFVDDPDTLLWGNQTYHRPMVERSQNQDIPAQAGYWQAPTPSDEQSARDFFESLDNESIAVVTSTDPSTAKVLSQYAHLVQSIKVPSWLNDQTNALYLFVAKKGSSPGLSERYDAAPITNWDDLKTVVDETLLLLNKAHVANERTEKSKYERIENLLQRPYIPASKVGQAGTMVPRNMQSALGFALSRLQENNGPIDDFVSAELGISIETLAERLSPEQVDAVGLAIDRLQDGRGFILSDETGLGKGRSVGSVATWAARQNKRVIFVTDRSNLFSDLARDLKDIGEWERFRPLITNSDGHIYDIMNGGQMIASPPTPAQMKRLMSQSIDSVANNMIMTTYSQLNSPGSEKGQWLEAMSEGAILILDEAHIAAGANSNTTRQIQSMIDRAQGVLYSSATWAQSYKNLHIFSRALPDSVNISQVISAMKAEGENFSETFSSMLAMDGALIRREHDLSKIEFVIDVDDINIERNKNVANTVAEILGEMAMISGEINNMLNRMSMDAFNTLQSAQNARDQISAAAIAQQDKIDEWQIELESEVAKSLQLRQTIAQLTSSEIEDIHPVPADQARENLDRANQNEDSEPDLDGLAIARLHVQLAQNQEAIDLLKTRIESAGQSVRAFSPPQKAEKLFSSRFGTGSAIYTTMRRTIAALSVDFTAQRIIQSVQNDKKPVVMLDETGETYVEELIKENIENVKNDIAQLRAKKALGQTLSEDDAIVERIAELLDSGAKDTEIVRKLRAPTIKDMMRKMLTTLGGVRINQTTQDTDAPQESQSDAALHANLLDLEGVTPELTQTYLNGVQRIESLIDTLPELPIIIFDALAAKLRDAGISVGEISGRRYSLEPKDSDPDLKGPLSLIERRHSKEKMQQTVAAFNNGDLDVVMFNQSGATGASYHASPRFKDQRQRVLFELQRPEKAVIRLQGLGRVGRYDQVVAPIIYMITTGLMSENRGLMMSNKKLGMMASTVRADKKHAAMFNDVPDLVNSLGDRVAQEYLLENPGIASRLSIPMAKIKEGRDLGNLITQRMSLLPDVQSEHLYKGLCEALDDMMVTDRITMRSHAVSVNDWRAKMIFQRHAWGPKENVETLSAFDSPVFERKIDFVHNYQPLQWADVRERVAQSSAALMQDSRIQLAQSKMSVKPHEGGVFIPNAMVTAEQRRMTGAEKETAFFTRIIESIVSALPESAFDGLNGPIAPTERQDLFSYEDDELGGQAELNIIQLPALTHKPKGFGSVAAQWLACQSRVSATDITRRAMVQISNSGKTAKFWLINNERSEALPYLVNLEKIDAQNLATIFKPLDPVALTPESWQIRRFDQVWGSIDPDIFLLSTQKAVNNAVATLENKRILGLTQTEFSTIEEALQGAEHNAVKEAHQRALFAKNILPRLVPGAQMSLRDKENKSAFDFFGQSRLIVTSVQLPEPGYEASLSKWRFTIASPGKENETTLSGAVLFKMAGDAPYFKNITIGRNVFEGMDFDLQVAKKSFDFFKPGNRTVSKTVLVGNMFQAGQWARASRRGSPIIYTDEAGQSHRAIEVKQGHIFQNVDFPLRLHNASMINAFLKNCFTQGQEAIMVYTSFKAALGAQANMQTGRNVTETDYLLIDKTNNALVIGIEKSEKEKIRSKLQSAVRADRQRWEAENPHEPYPVQFSTKVPRTNSEHANLIIKLPETDAGRIRFMNILTQSQGLEIFALRNTGAWGPANAATENYYANLAQPLLEDRERKQKAAERRAQTKQMLTIARGETDARPANDPSESQLNDAANEKSTKDTLSDQIKTSPLALEPVLSASASLDCEAPVARPPIPVFTGASHQ